MGMFHQTCTYLHARRASTELNGIFTIQRQLGCPSVPVVAAARAVRPYRRSPLLFRERKLPLYTDA